MDDLERADRLARALDNIIFGRVAEPVPELADHEMNHLLDVARQRREASADSRQAAVQYECAAWEKLISSLEGGTAPKPTESVPGEVLDETSQLAEVITMRRKLSDDARAVAEQHRDEVWDRIQTRMGATGKTRSDRGSTDAPRARGDAHDEYTSGDPEFDSLVRAALARAPSRPRDPEMTGRLWARVGGMATAGHAAIAIPGPAVDWPSFPFAGRALAVAAAIALLIAALGPVPASGLAHHPLVEALAGVAAGTGVIESSDPPAIPPEVSPVTGRDVTVEEAAQLMGLPVSLPSYLPGGFQLESSRYYPAGITAPRGGVFVLMYSESDDSASLAVYQESASGPSLIADSGTTLDATVARQLATYFEGGWQAADGTLFWEAHGSQTIVFESEGVRSIVHYAGSRIDPAELLAVADSLASR